MSVDAAKERPPVTRQQIEATAAEVRRLEPGVLAARRKVHDDSRKVALLRGTINHDRFLLKFRGVEREYELWPVGVMIVCPFAGFYGSILKLRSAISAVWIAGSVLRPHCQAATVTVTGNRLRGGMGVNTS